jgi:predicted pyridoxine 5'-phosphate oxidase superfamily flavin-nucleotide-binding protein
MLLTEAVHAAAHRSVLCWLATVDAQGQPNVSPKEVWAVVDEKHVVVGNIASPVTARNIAGQPQVCLSFIDVFVQKGYKLQGVAREVLAQDRDYSVWAAPLLAMTGTRFPLRSVLLIEVVSVQPIVALSYLFYPEETTDHTNRCSDADLRCAAGFLIPPTPTDTYAHLAPKQPQFFDLRVLLRHVPLGRGRLEPDTVWLHAAYAA